jgi:hypothetical protein
MMVKKKWVTPEIQKVVDKSDCLVRVKNLAPTQYKDFLDEYQCHKSLMQDMISKKEITIKEIVIMSLVLVFYWGEDRVVKHTVGVTLRDVRNLYKKYPFLAEYSPSKKKELKTKYSDVMDHVSMSLDEGTFIVDDEGKIYGNSNREEE